MIRMNVSQARSRRLHRVVALGATLMLAAGMSACSALKGESSSDASAPHTIAPGKTLTVSTSFYPIQYLAESIGGKLVKVSTVTPSNVEPHDFELSGKETAELGKADIIAYVPGFQPSLDKAVKEVGSGPTVVDLSKPANLVHHEGVEEEHEREYNELQKILLEEGFFESFDEEVWVCEVCGHVHRGKKAPGACPLCKAPREYFKKQRLV